MEIVSRNGTLSSLEDSQGDIYFDIRDKNGKTLYFCAVNSDGELIVVGGGNFIRVYNHATNGMTISQE